MSSLPRVVFAGSADFAVPSLAALLEAGYPVPAVLTQPDRPAGRGRRPRASPVKTYAALAGLPVWQPVTLKDEQARERLRAWSPDLLVVAAYGMLLPAPVLELPPIGCINVHASLLPRWRGAAPIARAVLAGDRCAGVSIMRMVEALDAGPVYALHELDVVDHETAGELGLRLANLGARALVEALPGIAHGRLEPVPQDESLATYAAKLDKSEAPLDWTRGADELARRVRAFNPWPVAETGAAGVKLRIWRARSVPLDSSAPPGSVVTARGDELVVATGDGGLRLEELQWPGKRVMSARDLVAGRSLVVGQRLT